MCCVYAMTFTDFYATHTHNKLVMWAMLFSKKKVWYRHFHNELRLIIGQLRPVVASNPIFRVRVWVWNNFSGSIFFEKVRVRARQRIVSSSSRGFASSNEPKFFRPKKSNIDPKLSIRSMFFFVILLYRNQILLILYCLMFTSCFKIVFSYFVCLFQA